MPDQKPAVSLAALPGRRLATLEIARQIEARGFAGIYTPSLQDNMSLCLSLAHVTKTIPFGTTIAPIYFRTPHDWGQAAAYLHEVSGGRFRFGIGVSHGPTLKRIGANAGKPLADTRKFVEELRALPRIGQLPPITLATLRQKMIALAGEIAEGMVFANGARTHMQASLGALPGAKRRDPNFFIGCMTPTTISDDVEAAKAVNRRTLTGYVQLPNYREYWKEAGYVEEMTAIEAAIAKGELDRLPSLMSDKWLADVTLFGPAAKVRDGLAAWREAGITTPILVPSSVGGNQMQALDEMFRAFA
ncbi:LLM class flavin-dependent oxidoreductase [Desertibaculum subflavum]|uniref:LLM class flavin-dependent oxidoreductase n=1 Tax=Desertibaculum subflavum TaxID=2268458 RepID=UPI000E66E2C1